ncbi:MAG: zf-TFIIB domain-containing protein [Desulfofustis sp. PB-SRB1]|jgi:Zn-finger nucleic acid-binding protein|nr:zf-TFIIB domain-containing protein [Desulfofustis sp. PB-SRB1]MBM1000940.1 zf-TFIIB domain-containing protein [Desulfofustis sp. PB-SRB1]HBH29996.1 hypothetical protein [Desulfofustis sp.]
MNCPVCRSPMVVFEYEQIELDYCTDCFGVWFDSGEIELMLEHIGLSENQIDLNFVTVAGTEAIRRCPICHRKMEKISPNGKSVVLDRCSNGHGIWFDANEIIETLRVPDDGPGRLSPSSEALLDFFKHVLKEEA